MTTATENTNKALASRFLDLVRAHDVDALIDMVTDDWTMVGGPPDLPAGAAGVRQLFAGFGRIEQSWQVEEILADGDLVAVRAINRVDQDAFLGIPAAGKLQVFTATFIHRVVDGRIARTQRNADDLDRLGSSAPPSTRHRPRPRSPPPARIRWSERSSCGSSPRPTTMPPLSRRSLAPTGLFTQLVRPAP